MDLQRLHENVGDRLNGSCAVCLRLFTEKLRGRDLPAERKARQYGAQYFAGDDLVCPPCYRYLDSDNTPNWANAWAAFTYSVLTGHRNTAVDASEYARCLPDTIKRGWSCVELFLPGVRRVWELPAKFHDCAKEMHHMRRQRNLMRDGCIVNSLNTYPFPTVRCPAGCWMYLDDFFRGHLELVPFHHYLAKVFRGLSDFFADASEFKCKRPEWPVRKRDLYWEVCSCLVLSNLKGLSVLRCSKERHESVKQFLHVPENPVLGNIQSGSVDLTAPCVVSTRLTRKPYVSENNTRYPVVQMRSSDAGVSSFALNPVPDTVHYVTDSDGASFGLVLNERPEIAASCKKNSKLGPEWCKSYMDYASETVSREEINRCKQQGTYIPVADAVAFTKAGIASVAADDRGFVRKVNSESIPIVHPSDSRGHRPFFVKRLSNQDDENSRRGSVINLVLFALVHNRELYCLFFAKVLDLNDPVLKRLHELVKKVVRSTVSFWRYVTRARLVDLETDLIVYSSDTFGDMVNVNLAGPCDAEDVAACIVSAVTGALLVRNFHDAAALNGTDAQIVVTCFAAAQPSGRVDLSLNRGELHLKLVGHVQRGRCDVVKTFFRWRTDTCWFACSSDAAGDIRESLRLPAGLVKLAVYVTDKCNLGLAREEFLNLCGGQTKVSCARHPDNFLIKEVIGSGKKCSQALCTNGIRWRCPFELELGNQCHNGLCLAHFRPLLEREGRVLLEFRAEDVDAAQPEVVDPEVENDIAHMLVENFFDDEEEEEAVRDAHDPYNDYFNLDIPQANNEFPAYTTGEEAATIESQDTCKTSGHFLLNAFMRILARAHAEGVAPVRLQRVLQHIYALMPEDSLPLLYPEAMLFPKIFPFHVGGAPLGAMPASLFDASNAGKDLNGLATMLEHFSVRLFDHSLLTSSDHFYLSFAFDSILNDSLNRNSIAIVMKKGLEHITRVFTHSEESERSLSFDEINSPKEVNKLVNLFRQEGGWTYFITLTCNDEKTFGVAPIRAAIMDLYAHDDEKREQALLSYAGIMCRSWERSIRHYFDYALNSPERPLGHIKTFWYRFEHQTGEGHGNKSHFHGGVRLHEDDQNLIKNRERIACSNSDAFSLPRRTDKRSLIKSGLVKNNSEYSELIELHLKLQYHSCASSNSRCQKTNFEGKTVCRVPHHPASFSYKFNRVNSYTEETLKNLEYLDLARQERGEIIELHPSLYGGRWQYPAKPNETCVPTIPRLFAAFQSNCNVQLCDQRLDACYCIKYAAGKEDRRQVILRNTNVDSSRLSVDALELANEKIASCRAARKKELEDEGVYSYAREVSQSEMLWFVLNLPYICSNVDWTHVNTHPPEYRPAVRKLRGGAPSKLVNERGELRSTEIRAALPDWRQFTEDQNLHILEYCNGRYVLDNTSAFSVRPPELLRVDSLMTYFRFFIRSKSPTNATVTIDLEANCFLDGVGKCVRVRIRYLEAVRDYFLGLSRVADPRANDGVHELARLFSRCLEAFDRRERDNPLLSRFVDLEADRSCVVVPSPISPLNTEKLIYSLILTKGRFSTEMRLNRCRDLRDALQLVDLIPDRDNVSVQQARALARKYVVEDLSFAPVNSRQLGRYVASLCQQFIPYLSGQNVVREGMPLVTQRSIQEKASAELRELEEERLDCLIAALQTHCPDVVPDRAVLEGEGGAVAFAPNLVAIPGQSPDSIAEQRVVLRSCCDAINSLNDPLVVTAKSIMIVGPPGAGKTYLMLNACMYALSRQLRTAMVSMTSERARVVGGEHFHLLLGMRADQTIENGATVMAEKCLLSLARKPVKCAYLKRLDIIFFEEIGLLPATLFAVLDLVLQRIRGSKKPFGGVLIIGTGDHRQLRPIGDSEIWPTMVVRTICKVFLLKHFVRARADRALQRVIQVLRQPVIEEDEIEAVLEVFHRQRFVADWRDVPNNTLRVVGKKSGERAVIKQYLDTIKATYPCQVHRCSDQVESARGNWDDAPANVTPTLSYKCLEEEELVLHEGAVMRLTFNNVRAGGGMPVFSQGQLAVVTQLPDVRQPKQLQRLIVRVVPPGFRAIDVNNIPADWPLCTLSRRQSVPVVLGRGSLRGRRVQWPLRYFVTFTVHRIIGETCESLATKISHSDSDYSLWEREQLLVIVSRVHRLNDLTFVGSRDDTCVAIRKLLELKNPLANYTCKLIESMDVMSLGNAVIDIPADYPQSLPVELPYADFGSVYIAVSAKFPSCWELESGSCLRRAFQDKNRADFSERQSKRPWVLAAFVSGFPGQSYEEENFDLRTQVLQSLRQRFDQVTGAGPRISWQRACIVGKELLVTLPANQSKLTWSQCIRLECLRAD